MKIKDLRSLPVDGLKAKLAELKLELAIEKRNIVQTGVANKKIKSKEMRRTVAQIMTLLKERGVSS